MAKKVSMKIRIAILYCAILLMLCIMYSYVYNRYSILHSAVEFNPITKQQMCNYLSSNSEMKAFINPKIGAFSTLEPKNVGQFSSADNLMLLRNTFVLPFAPLSKTKFQTEIEYKSMNDPPFMVFNPELFLMCNYSSSSAAHFAKQMTGISLIFVEDVFMNHFFHFFEHLLGVYASIQELYSNTNYSVKYALFPNMNYEYCTGKYNINQKTLKILWPNIRILCGKEIKEMSNTSIFALHHSIISTRRHGAMFGEPCNTIATCWWNKMDGSYIHIIKKHSLSLARKIVSQITINKNNMKHFLELPTNVKYRLCYISRENNDGRTLVQSVRELFLKARKEHSYFGNEQDMFDFKVLKLEEYVFEEQIAVISTCNLIISLHGNGLSHVLWMAIQSQFPDKKLVVELLPGHGLKVNDYMLQSEFAHAFHIQWDIGANKLRSGSLDFGNFNHCSIQFYECRGDPNLLVDNWNMHAIIHMFDVIQIVWQFIVRDEHYYSMNHSALRAALNDEECVKFQ